VRHRPPHVPATNALVVAALAAAVVSAATGCKSKPASTIGPSLPGEPVIRVRVDAGRDTLTLEGPDAVLIGPPRTAEPDRCRTPLTLVHRNDRWHIDGRPELAWRGPLALADPEGGALPLGDRRYPERLILVPRPDLPPFDKTRDRFDVVNHVHLEAYLPGVLDKELYPGWRPTTFYAQAIAARSYAIHHMLHAAADRHYDVESTQASQVYGGATKNLRAVQAVLETTGLVLTDGERVLQAFYSSTCGGAGASPTDAFGGETAQAPLVPEPRQAWCRDSKHFAWPTIRRSRAALAPRLAAWGRAHHHAIARLREIKSIAVDARNHVGRPSRFVVVDGSGERFTLPAEPFRQACNFRADRLPPPGARLKSAFLDVARLGRQIEFTAGRGFGHGVGLCQFGAQAMAEHGHDVLEILNTYYPAARVERAY